MTTPYVTPNTTSPELKQDNDHDLDHMAKMTRHLNYAILLQILWFLIAAVVFSMAGSEISLMLLVMAPILFGIIIFAGVSVFRLMKAVSGALAATILMLVMLLPVPFLNIIIILIVNSIASKTLKKSGYKIGLLGAKKIA